MSLDDSGICGVYGAFITGSTCPNCGHNLLCVRETNELQALRDRVKELEAEVDEFAKVDADDKMYIAEVEALYKKRIEELEAENEKLKATITELSANTINEVWQDVDRKRIRNLEAENETLRTRHTMIWCEADAWHRRFVKVRDAAQRVIKDQERMCNEASKNTGGLHLPLSTEHMLLKQALKDTEEI